MTAWIGGILHWVAAALRTHPELAIFLTLGLGYWIGKFRIGSFTLGSVTGVLIAGVLIGQLKIAVPPLVQTVFFLLFLFSIGYKVGPQFFRGLRKEALPQVALTVILCATGLTFTWLAALVLGYDPGTAAGLIAGALTESATVGTASDAIGRLGLSPAEQTRLIGNLTSAFAVAYLIGVVGVTWFLSSLAPRIMRINLTAACRELEERMGGRRMAPPGVFSARRQFELRAYRLSERSAARPIAWWESRYGEDRLFIERIRRQDRIIEADPLALLYGGDIIAVGGRREVLLRRQAEIGDETDDQELIDVPAAALDIVITNKDVVGKTLGELAHREGARSVFLRDITRAGQQLPLTPSTTVDRGDVLTVVGSPRRLDELATRLGFADRATTATDMIVVGLGIVAGGLLGIPTFTFGKLEIGLGVSVGALVGGLVCGWLRATYRSFPQIPEAALWLFDSVGLTGFIAVLGISAGPQFVGGLQQAGVGIVFAAILAVITPHLVAVLIGHRLMKLHPGILLGVCAGAGTSGPALAAIQEAADSKIPALGYGVSYAIGNVLLALWGTVIVTVLA